MLFQGRHVETEYKVTVAQAVRHFAVLRGKVGAGNGQGIVTNTTRGIIANAVAGDNEGLAFVRSPAQASGKW